MSNNHYVPKLVLKKFKNKLCLYNVRTGEYKENVSVEDAYYEENLYDDETEAKLNRLVESQFGGLLANKLLVSDNGICLYRHQVSLIKKFLLISLFRCRDGEKFASFEKNTVENGCGGLSSLCPFEERTIDGETDYEYWIRTLNVILDSDGTPENILEHPLKTYSAWRWAFLMKGAYLAFWDAPAGEEFVITDEGMTSENEKGWNGITVHNHKKLDYMNSVLKEVSNRGSKRDIEKAMQDIEVQANFGENFMMFPISAKRMIVLISPYFKKIYEWGVFGVPPIPFGELTNMSNPDLFAPNKNRYKHKQKVGELRLHKEDLYLYDVKRLSREDLRYCNSLFLDRIDEYLGCSSIETVGQSILTYRFLNDFVYMRRPDDYKNYEPLYEILDEYYNEKYSCDT
jgi:hypothetical protein